MTNTYKILGQETSIGDIEKYTTVYSPINAQSSISNISITNADAEDAQYNLSFVKSQDVPTSSISLTTILTPESPAGFNLLTNNIPEDRGSTGLNTLYGSFNNSSGLDELDVAISFPTGYNQIFSRPDQYSAGVLNANSWFYFGGVVNDEIAGTATNPNVPTLHISSVPNSIADNSIAFAGTEEYIDPVWGNVFRIRYHGNNVYNISNLETQTKFDLYFVKNQPSVYIIVFRQFFADPSGLEQLGFSDGNQWIDIKYNSITPFAGTAWLLRSVADPGVTITDTYLTSSNAQKIISSILIEPGKTHEINGGICLQNGDQIRISSNSDKIITNVYGVEIE